MQLCRDQQLSHVLSTSMPPETSCRRTHRAIGLRIQPGVANQTQRDLDRSKARTGSHKRPTIDKLQKGFRWWSDLIILPNQDRKAKRKEVKKKNQEKGRGKEKKKRGQKRGGAKKPTPRSDLPLDPVPESNRRTRAVVPSPGTASPWVGKGTLLSPD